MGASGWSYVTPYRGSVGASLEALREEVFAQEYGDGEEYSTIEELYADREFMEEEGTHSILDIRRVSAECGTQFVRRHPQEQFRAVTSEQSGRMPRSARRHLHRQVASHVLGPVPAQAQRPLGP